MKWQYVKEGDILDRHWFVKWWDEFPQTKLIIQTVYKDFIKKNDSSKTNSTAIAAKLATPSDFLPPPEEEKPVAATSPSSSKTKKSKKKNKGPSKKEMEMFKQFLKSFREDDSNTEEDEAEENSETFSSPSHNSLFGHDLLCSQDPVPGIDDIPELNY